VTLALDHSTIVFTLPAPRASFLSTLTQLPILPLANTTAAHAATLASHAAAPMATSGAYVVTASTPSLISLAPNPYAQQQPVMKSVQLLLFSSFEDAAAAFAAGRTDAVLTVTPAQRARLLRTSGAHAYDIATFRFVDLLFNERVPQLADPLVRQALAAAVTRKALLADPLQQAGGLLQVDAVTEGLPWVATREPQEQASPATANAMLDSAGWTVGPAGPRVKNGQALAFTLTVPDADPLPLVAKAIAQQMSGIGVTINVQVVPALTFVDKNLVPHTFELALADWDEGPDPDVSSFWHSSALPPQGYNVSGGQADLFLDRALDNVATTYDARARIAAAKDVDRLLTADGPGLLLYTPEVSYVVRVPMRGAGPGRYGGSAARFDVMATWQRA
jgi:peptide/nickel transport system substrate-binding protein